MREPQLTSQGEQRREAILRIMKEAASHRRRRHHEMRAISACLVLALAVTLAIRLMRPQSGGAMRPASEIAKALRRPIDTSPATPVQPALVIGTIETDPTILSRWSAKPSGKQSANTVQLITDDDEMIHTLAAAGQPAGIIEVDGHATLVTSSANQ